jgi:esterase/lipase superfamily enzyme
VNLVETRCAGAKPTCFVFLRKAPRLLAALIVVATSAACASRPENGFVSSATESAAGGSAHTLLVATTRERDARPGTLFNGERAAALDYATVTVSIPPNHKPGNIESPATAPGNPNIEFVAGDAEYIEGDKIFIGALNAQLAARPRGSRKVLLFIHGYNTLFAEGIFRFAQIVHDSKASGVPVLFTWASRGKLRDYLYDTNSATAARDNLEHTLRLLLASDADQVNILAHSMGNWVTVEALRQIRISGNLQHAEKVGSVFLAAPDIDLDVFKSQMQRFGKPRKPFYIVLSRDDKALAFSKFIAGGESRVGADQNVDELAALGATVIDLTNVKGIDASDHDKFAQLAAVAPEMRAVLSRGIGTASTGEPSPGDPVGAVAALSVTMLGAPIKIFGGE